MNKLFRRCLAFLQRSRIHRDLEEEMRTHLEMKAAEFRASGLSPSTARQAAQREFGNAILLREQSRDAFISAIVAVALILRSLLFGIAPLDPPALIAVVVVLLATGALACYLPARRASRIDPMEALRHE